MTANQADSDQRYGLQLRKILDVGPGESDRATGETAEAIRRVVEISRLSDYCEGVHTPSCRLRGLENG